MILLFQGNLEENSEKLDSGIKTEQSSPSRNDPGGVELNSGSPLLHNIKKEEIESIESLDQTMKPTAGDNPWTQPSSQQVNHTRRSK